MLSEAGRRRSFARLASALAAAALLASATALALPDHDRITHAAARNRHSDHAHSAPVAARRRPARAEPVRLLGAVLTIAPTAATTRVPASYFGLSTEYWTLPLFERDMPVFERVLSLLHVPGNGPLVLRIGGDSADHSFWAPKARKMPGWAFALTPAYLSRLRALVTHDHVRLIVDLNLVTDTPLTAATWARAAETSLPRGSIIGFEVGNEPDIYERSYWLATVARSPLETRPLPFELTPDSYVDAFNAYARVLGEGAPDVPLIGPAVAHPVLSLNWIQTLIDDERPELRTVSAHLYPYSACEKPRSHGYPTIARLLSRQASAGLGKDVASAVAVAHRAGLKFRLTEINSVTCSGKAGVSNTFATALWAPDALFSLMRAGVDGVNLHARADASNAPFSITRRGLQARPLLYGLTLFTRTLGPDAGLVRLHLSAPRRLNLSAWAVRVRGGGLHVLVIDKSGDSARVDLRLPATGPATVQRLLAPLARSRSGVTLNGQELGSDGAWTGTPRTESITRSSGGYELTMPRLSAALVGVHTWGRSEHDGGVAVPDRDRVK